MSLAVRTLDRVSVLAAAALAAAGLTALSPRLMEHWDEVQLELGMRRFDLAWHEPHPPGYVLFVLAGRIVSWTGALHPGRVLSLLATLVWLALVARHLPESSRPTRHARPFVVASTVFLSPTLFLYATTGRTYVVEAVLWVATLLALAAERRTTAAALAGVGGGFRPTVLVFGVVALAGSSLRADRRSRARAALALVASAAVWILALAILCGGLSRYLALSAPLLSGNVMSKSIFAIGPRAIFLGRLPLMLQSVWDGAGATLLLVPFALLARRRSAAIRRLDPLLYGAGIAFAFYLLTIYDSSGYSLSYVLPLLTWTIVASSALVAERAVRPLHVAALLTAVLALWLVLPGGMASERTVLAHRARVQARAAARLAELEKLPARSTLIVTGAETFVGWSFRVAMYEDPSRPTVQLSRDRFVAALTAERPYLAAVDRRTTAVSDGDVTALPFFRDAPLRYVVFTAPAEVTARLDPSCIAAAKPVITTEGDSMPVLEPSATLRVRIENGRLVCR